MLWSSRRRAACSCNIPAWIPHASLFLHRYHAVVLTVLSCLAGNARLRSAMARCNARRRLVDFGQRNPDPRLRARSLSLVKVGW